MVTGACWVVDVEAVDVAAGAVVGLAAAGDEADGAGDEQAAKTRERTVIANRMMTDNLFIDTPPFKYFARS